MQVVRMWMGGQDHTDLQKLDPPLPGIPLALLNACMSPLCMSPPCMHSIAYLTMVLKLSSVCSNALGSFKNGIRAYSDTHAVLFPTRLVSPVLQQR